jgi:hypothetical protein
MRIYILKTPCHITTVSSKSDNFYIKRPKLTSYEEVKGIGFLSKLLLQEAETLELLMNKPYDNLVKYHGCFVNRGRIIGLALERYNTWTC